MFLHMESRDSESGLFNYSQQQQNRFIELGLESNFTQPRQHNRILNTSNPHVGRTPCLPSTRR